MGYAVSSSGLLLIERNEGFRSRQYLDVDGTPTIGFGTTASVISPLPKTCTVAEATGWLKLYVNRDIIPAIQSLGLGDLLGQNRIDALCDLAYNCGAGIISGDSQIADDLRAKDFSAASSAFLIYDHDEDGNVLPDLQRRREEERELFDTPEPAPAKGTVRFVGSCDLADDRWSVHQIPGTAHYGSVARTFAAEAQLQVTDGKSHWRAKGIPADTKFAPMTDPSPTVAKGVAHFEGSLNLATGTWSIHRIPGSAHYGTDKLNWSAVLKLAIDADGKHQLTVDRVPRDAAPLGA